MRHSPGPLLAFSNYGVGRCTEVAIWAWVMSRAETWRLRWVHEVRDWVTVGMRQIWEQEALDQYNPYRQRPT